MLVYIVIENLNAFPAVQKRKEILR